MNSRFPGLRSSMNKVVRAQTSVLSQEWPRVRLVLWSWHSQEGLRIWGGKNEGHVCGSPSMFAPHLTTENENPPMNHVTAPGGGPPPPQRGLPPGRRGTSVVTGLSHLGDLSTHVAWGSRRYPAGTRTALLHSQHIYCNQHTYTHTGTQHVHTYTQKPKVHFFYTFPHYMQHTDFYYVF